jgi:hypothetical protein
MPRHAEADAFRRYISSSLARTVACLDGLTEDEIDWRPATPEASCLRDLAVHSIANAEENVLAVACGVPVARPRDGEFSSGMAVGAIRARLADVLKAIDRRLDALSADDLDAERDHPRRGRLPCREVLLVAARHAAEHMGQAELTRDLVLAMRDPAG